MRKKCKPDGSVVLTAAEVAAYNTFFAICDNSTDPNVLKGLVVLEKALDDDDGTLDQKHEPPGDQP